MRIFSAPSNLARTGLAVFAMLVGCGSALAADLLDAPVPFEERAGELLAQVEFELQLGEIVLLNPYLEADSPRVDEFDAVWNDLTRAADALIAYSLDVVQIVEQKKSDQDVQELVPLLRELAEAMNALPAVQRNLSIDDVGGVLQNVAQQKTLVKALRQASPITDAVADALRQTVVDANDAFDLAFEETYNKVMTEQQPVTEYTNKLVEQRNDVLNAMLLLESARSGDADAWSELLESKPAVAMAVSIADHENVASLDQAEAVLIRELAKVMEIWSYLKPSFDEYRAVLGELYAVENDMRQIFSLATLIAENWDKAQRQLAKGRPSAFSSVASGLLQLAVKRAAR